jgi:signal transduction histidine kinase
MADANNLGLNNKLHDTVSTVESGDLFLTREQSLLSLVYSQAYLGLLASCFCAAIIFFRIHHYTDMPILTIWFIIFLIITFIRIIIIKRFSYKKNTEKDISLRRKFFIISSLLSGIGWGSVAVILFNDKNISDQMFIIMILAGVTAGGVPFLAGIRTAAIGFLLTTLLPVISSFFFMGSIPDVLMAFAIFIFLLFLILLSVKTNIMLNETFVLQFELSKSKKLLLVANKELEADIGKRIENEKNIAQLNEKLIVSARRAGMADVATSILHNIGNVLNSVKVSVGSLQQSFGDNSKLSKLLSVTKMINENLDNLTQYLTEDPKGKILPKYLIGLAQNISNENTEINKELASLTEHVKHIEDIVAMQKSISGISGLSERIFLADVIEAAIQITLPESETTTIVIKKDYQITPFIITDKSKLLQILVNVIQNAKQALLKSNNNPIKELTLRLVSSPTDNQAISIVIIDNGIGIPPENLTKIFSLGFTTKTDGHGFGLHSSALAAKDIGGDLHAESAGLAKGTTFILNLPLSDNLKGRFVNARK